MPQQRWHEPQPQNMQMPVQDPYMHPEADEAVHEWAAKQQAHHRLHRVPRTAGPSRSYAPSHASNRSESLDGQDPVRGSLAGAHATQSRLGSQAPLAHSRSQDPMRSQDPLRNQYAQMGVNQPGVGGPASAQYHSQGSQYSAQYAPHAGRYEPSLPQYDQIPEQRPRPTSSRHHRGTR